jgi:hypothetical protein
VSVRETPFLELDDVHVSDDFADNAVFVIGEFFKEKIEFNLEYPGDDIWMVLSSLTMLEKDGDFCP